MGSHRLYILKDSGGIVEARSLPGDRREEGRGSVAAALAVAVELECVVGHREFVGVFRAKLAEVDGAHGQANGVPALEADEMMVVLAAPMKLKTGALPALQVDLADEPRLSQQLEVAVDRVEADVGKRGFDPSWSARAVSGASLSERISIMRSRCGVRRYPFIFSCSRTFSTDGIGLTSSPLTREPRAPR